MMQERAGQDFILSGTEQKTALMEGGLCLGIRNENKEGRCENKKPA